MLELLKLTLLLLGVAIVFTLLWRAFWFLWRIAWACLAVWLDRLEEKRMTPGELAAKRCREIREAIHNQHR